MVNYIKKEGNVLRVAIKEAVGESSGKVDYFLLHKSKYFSLFSLLLHNNKYNRIFSAFFSWTYILAVGV